MRIYHDFFLVPGSRSTFRDTDPDPKHWLLDWLWKEMKNILTVFFMPL